MCNARATQTMTWYLDGNLCVTQQMHTQAHFSEGAIAQRPTQYIHAAQFRRKRIAELSGAVISVTWHGQARAASATICATVMSRWAQK